MGRIADIALWISRRLRLAVLALIAVAAVKTAAAGLDAGAALPGASAPISTEGTVVSR